MNKFVELISEAFADELVNTKDKYETYDPFRDHYEDTHPEGKSYFINPDDSGFLSPNGIKIILTEKPDENTRLVTIQFTAEYFDPQEGGITAASGPETGYNWKSPCGKFIVTECDEFATPELKVREGHGELQFYGRASDWHTVEEKTNEATVILAKEDGKWLLATAFPGPASAHNNQERMKELACLEYLDTGFLPDDANDTSHIQIKTDEEFEAL